MYIFFCWSTRKSSPSFKLETKHVWNHNLEEIRWSPLEMYRYTLFIYDVFSTNLGWFPKFWEPSTVSTANLIWDLPKFQMVFARNSPLRMISELRVDHTPPRIHVMMVYLYAYVFWLIFIVNVGKSTNPAVPLGTEWESFFWNMFPPWFPPGFIFKKNCL